MYDWLVQSMSTVINLLCWIIVRNLYTYLCHPRFRCFFSSTQTADTFDSLVFKNYTYHVYLPISVIKLDINDLLVNIDRHLVYYKV